MCKHILNAQVSIRAPCCRRFFDCADCHAEVSDHALLQSDVMSLVCKKCRKAFRLDVTEGVDEAREYCPHCDNHFLREAIEPKAALVAENADTRQDNRLAQLRDLRMKMLVDDNDDGDLFADDDAGASTRLG